MYLNTSNGTIAPNNTTIGNTSGDITLIGTMINVSSERTILGSPIIGSSTDLYGSTLTINSGPPNFSGSTSIGNSSGFLGLYGSTVQATSTNIYLNTTNIGDTTIGNNTGSLVLAGNTINASANNISLNIINGNTTVGNTNNKLTLKGSTIELNGDIRNIDAVNPTLTDNSLTLKTYVISVSTIPGTIIIWPSVTGPPNNQYNSAIKAYLYCDGATYSKALYPDLSNAIALSFPDASPSINFKVPDLRSTFIVGAQGAGDRRYRNSATGGSVGVKLDVNHIPSHHTLLVQILEVHRVMLLLLQI
jgi:hypothetical protein